MTGPNQPRPTPVLTAEILLSQALADLDFKVVAGERGLSRRISWGRIQRPGLAFAGFLAFIKPGRIQILGESELTYLDTMAADVRLEGNKAAAAAAWSTFERWLQAYDKADLEKTMETFDPGVVFTFQGGKDQSYADLRKGYEQDFRTRTPGGTWVPLVDEVYADGNLAFVRSTWEFRVPMADGGGSQVKERNRSVDILRLADKKWRIIRSFNFPEKAAK